MKGQILKGALADNYLILGKFQLVSFFNILVMKDFVFAEPAESFCKS